MSELYDEDYFLRGKETGKSLYENYRWIPELTVPMAKSIVKHCGIKQDQRILDFGCARGYLVRALRELGHEAYGYDESRWALDNLDPVAQPFINSVVGYTPFWKREKFDWVIAKDVLEHIDEFIRLRVFSF